MPCIEMRVSNCSLPLKSLGWGVAAHERFFKRIGVTSGEFAARHDVFFGRIALLSLRRYIGGHEARQPSLTYEQQAIARLAATGHMSFREDSAATIARQLALEALRGPRNKDLIKKIGRRAAMATIFPERIASNLHLRALQHVVGRPMGMVMYPEVFDGRVVYGKSVFGSTMAQPTANWFGQRRLPSDAPASLVMSEFHAQGIDELCPDLLHLQREYPTWPYRIADFRALVRDMATNYGDRLGGVHLALNRLDVAPPHSGLAQSTAKAYRAFCTSASAAGKTPEGEMLVDIVRARQAQGHHNPLPVVLEVPPTVVDNDAMATDYRAIVEHTYELTQA